MPLQATSGAASYDAFGGGVPVVPAYIEDIFSCFLYTGNGSTQTITNGIDLSGKGGLVWWKNRTNATGHGLIDTTRGIDYYLSSNTTDAQDGPASYISSVSSTGYSIGVGTQFVNQSANNYASWTFRKQPKFFDVVTYTGNSTARTIPHNLGSVPKVIIIKELNASGWWWSVYYGIADKYLKLNTTDAADTSTDIWNNTQPTSTEFSVGFFNPVNTTGTTYVAYLFAHNAGGFGLTGTDNVISCGSFTTDPSTGGATVNLGYEPQWLLVKSATSVQGWHLIDNMRGMANLGTYGDAAFVEPNTSSAESTGANCYPTANGFWYARSGSTTYIYIAIRRGPMKVPTSGTSVFSPIARTGTGTSTAVTTPNFPPDMLLQARRGAPDWPMSDRLRGVGQNLAPCYTSAESTPSPAYVESYDMTGATLGSGNAVNGSGLTYIEYFFRRAPSFFDEVCFTGAGSVQNVSHNLAAVPELMILKQRNGVTNWMVYHSALGNTKAIYLDSTTNASSASAGFWNNTSPTSSVFTVSMVFDINGSGSTSVAYLFATCAGVSKVGSYTGTATTKQIDCGFTGGARFVLIKRTDASGDWYVWDSARGIVAGNDPYLLLNSTAAEVTSTDYIDTYSAGFEISSTAPAAINASGGSFIFFAVA